MKVLQPAAVTQEESFGSEFLNSIITCGFYVIDKAWARGF